MLQNSSMSVADVGWHTQLGVGVCLGKQKSREGGFMGDIHQGQSSASSEAGRCAGRLPWPAATLSKSLSQSCGDAWRLERRGLCYRTG